MEVNLPDVDVPELIKTLGQLLGRIQKEVEDKLFKRNDQLNAALAQVAVANKRADDLQATLNAENVDLAAAKAQIADLQKALGSVGDTHLTAGDVDTLVNVKGALDNIENLLTNPPVAAPDVPPGSESEPSGNVSTEPAPTEQGGGEVVPSGPAPGGDVPPADTAPDSGVHEVGAGDGGTGEG